MGCDIHMHVETKDEDGIWRHVDDPRGDFETLPRWVNMASRLGWYDAWLAYKDEAPEWLWSARNYCLFSVLAGVRREDEHLVAKERGLPHDVSSATHLSALYWAEDAHTHSWLTAAELAAFDWRPTGSEDERIDEFFDGTVPALLALDDDPANVRVVFWFDN